MEQLNTNQLKELKEYYKSKKLLIVSINDTNNIEKKYLNKIVSDLKYESVDVSLINLLTSSFNKTEYLDYILKENVKLGDISKLITEGRVEKLKNKLKSYNLPLFISYLEYIKKQKFDDSSIGICDAIILADHPVILYDNGIPNLIRQISGTDDLKYLQKLNSYEYILYVCSRMNNNYNLNKVLYGIESNLENLLRLNKQSNIFVFGTTIPELRNEKLFNNFMTLLLKYNESLESISNKYNLTFINTYSLQEKYGLDSNNFKLVIDGKKKIKDIIITNIYENVDVVRNNKYVDSLEDSIKSDFKFVSMEKVINLLLNENEGSPKFETRLNINREKLREEQVLRKVLKYEDK